MAINKNFVVKNGFEASTDLIVADAVTRRVGVGTTAAIHTLMLMVALEQQLLLFLVLVLLQMN